MEFSRTCLIAVALPFLLSLAGCKEPNKVERLASPDAATSTGATDPSMKVDKPVYLVGELCNVESIDGQTLGVEPFRLGVASSVRGWLADDMGRMPERPMLILADQNKKVAAQYPFTLTVSRPDVVKAFPDKQIPVKSGFEVKLGPVGMPSKTYHLYLTYAADDQLYVCDNGRNAQVP